MFMTFHAVLPSPRNSASSAPPSEAQSLPMRVGPLVETKGTIGEVQINIKQLEALDVEHNVLVKLVSREDVIDSALSLPKLASLDGFILISISGRRMSVSSVVRPRALNL